MCELTQHSSLELDISVIDYNLSLSIEERIRNHERSRTLVEKLRNAGDEAYGEREFVF